MSAKKDKAGDARAAKVVPFTQRPCPVCGKPAVVEYRPFCSKRCADLDLGQWLDGGYRIPTDEVPDDGEMPEE